jgi:bla regulator protein blaR1
VPGFLAPEELCHVRRRDNLASLVHMLVEAAFWFHPLVWFIGARLTDERERACDEEVLRQGNEPQIYAESVLQVCKFYLRSPMECVSSISGSDLKRRIERIMTRRIVAPLDLGRKLILAILGTAAVATPVVIGLMNAPSSRAQSASPVAIGPQFEVASVKIVNHPVPFHPYGLKYKPRNRYDRCRSPEVHHRNGLFHSSCPHSGWAGLAQR